MYYNGNKVFISNNTNLYFKKDHKCEEDFIMKEKLMINITKPQYVQVSDITYAQVDSWYDHCRRDLKLDLIYPEDMSDKRYPCIVWICGGGWISQHIYHILARLLIRVLLFAVWNTVHQMRVAILCR